jgi:exosortase
MMAAVWLPVVYLLGAQWTFFEEYHYGWAVPAACVFFAWQSARALPQPASDRRSGRGTILLLGAVIGLLYWSCRVLQEANPLWRAASYGLAITAGAITLLLVYFAGGTQWVKRFLFPVAFFLIAVPWPTQLEGKVVQALTRLDTSIVVELLGFLGIPALMHGNVIELSASSVGVEEACSGIRSLQATVMIALFFGEHFRLKRNRRVGLLAGGISLAMLFNICRTFFLTWLAARFGGAMTEKWHDPAGIFVFICFMATWLLALFLHGKTNEAGVMNQSKSTSESSPMPGVIARLWPVAVTIVLCVAFIEISTEAWFRAHEQRGETIQWSARWPKMNPRDQLVSANVREIMRFDEADGSEWRDASNRAWLGFYFRWFPASSFYGRMKVALAKGHSPEICLHASGWALQSELDSGTVPVGLGLNLPFHRYIFQRDGKTLYVFFAVVEDQLNGSAPGFLRTRQWDRIRAAISGSRNFGERSVEVAVAGYNSADEAWQAFQTALPKWIQQEGVTSPRETLVKTE